jgi:hypothetical protein
MVRSEKIKRSKNSYIPCFFLRLQLNKQFKSLHCFIFLFSPTPIMDFKEIFIFLQSRISSLIPLNYLWMLLKWLSWGENNVGFKFDMLLELPSDFLLENLRIKCLDWFSTQKLKLQETWGSYSSLRRWSKPSWGIPSHEHHFQLFLSPARVRINSFFPCYLLN